MSRILVIDDRGKNEHPQIDDYEMIDFFENCNCPQNIDPNNYLVAIIHQRNTSELEWAKNNFEKVIIISGGLDEPELVRNRFYYIPREIYKKYFSEFINKCFLENNVDYLIFWR